MQPRAFYAIGLGSRMHDSQRVQGWMEAMSLRLSVATCLHRINQTKRSPFCTQCVSRSLAFSQFLSWISPCLDSSSQPSPKSQFWWHKWHAFYHSAICAVLSMLGQQLTTKSARLWQLPFINIWQLIGRFWWHKWYALNHSAICADSRVVKGYQNCNPGDLGSILLLLRFWRSPWTC